MVVLQKLLKVKELLGKEVVYATTLKIWLMKRIRSLTAPLGTPSTCPFLIMFMISYPLIVRRAVLNEPNPVMLQIYC